jgi:hypothetical protein
VRCWSGQNVHIRWSRQLGARTESEATMHRPLADQHGYRGIEYSVWQTSQETWNWGYYPKVERGLAKRGQVQGDKGTALIAVKAAIDEFLGPRS